VADLIHLIGLDPTFEINPAISHVTPSFHCTERRYGAGGEEMATSSLH
jgi:hypothetical protein